MKDAVIRSRFRTLRPELYCLCQGFVLIFLRKYLSQKVFSLFSPGPGKERFYACYGKGRLQDSHQLPPAGVSFLFCQAKEPSNSSVTSEAYCQEKDQFGPCLKTYNSGHAIEDDREREGRKKRPHKTLLKKIEHG